MENPMNNEINEMTWHEFEEYFEKEFGSLFRLNHQSGQIYVYSKPHECYLAHGDMSTTTKSEFLKDLQENNA